MQFLFGLATVVGRLIGLNDEPVLPRWTPVAVAAVAAVAASAGAVERIAPDKWLAIAEGGRAVPTTWISVRGGRPV
jgi:hypothetical protein